MNTTAKTPSAPVQNAETALAPETNSPTIQYPWQEAWVREDVIKTFNLRLPEPWMIKLQYLSEKTRKSQQELIREKLLPGIEEEINRLIAQG